MTKLSSEWVQNRNNGTWLGQKSWEIEMIMFKHEKFFNIYFCLKSICDNRKQLLSGINWQWHFNRWIFKLRHSRPFTFINNQWLTIICSIGNKYIYTFKMVPSLVSWVLSFLDLCCKYLCLNIALIKGGDRQFENRNTLSEYHSCISTYRYTYFLIF